MTVALEAEACYHERRFTPGIGSSKIADIIRKKTRYLCGNVGSETGKAFQVGFHTNGMVAEKIRIVKALFNDDVGQAQGQGASGTRTGLEVKVRGICGIR